MAKLYRVALACVLVAFVCVSCSLFTPGIEGRYVNGDPELYRWTELELVAGNVYATNINTHTHGAYTVERDELTIRWDDGTRETFRFKIRSNGALDLGGGEYYNRLATY